MESAMEKGANHLSHPIFASMSDWRSCLTVEPGELGGKPCVRGMRMSVADILEYLAADMRTSWRACPMQPSVSGNAAKPTSLRETALRRKSQSVARDHDYVVFDRPLWL